MVDKYIARDATTGVIKEVIGQVSSAGAGDAGKIPALDTDGRFNLTLMPTGVGPDTYTGNAAEALTAGDMVYVDSAGEVSKASAAAAGHDAVGFVQDNVSSGQPALVYFEGRCTALAGLTPDSRYFLSASAPGGITATPVTGAGKRHQFVGRAITATTLSFEADDSILLA